MSSHTDAEDGREYAVVVNHEEQYSIWPTGRELPAGWRTVGVTGSRPDCLAHIDAVWTDMRPRSVVLAMAAAGSELSSEPDPEGPARA